FYTTKKEGKGVGLGLSVCYGIIERHDGTIEVSSTPGRGSTFIIELPLHPGEKGGDKFPLEKEQISAKGVTGGKSNES
ncbi:unnamed protein product, partial [marine sediment metagenome]